MLGPRPDASRGLSVVVPLAYLVAAALAFAAAALGVPWLARDLAGHYYHPHLLALTHTVTLGWITLAIMGASYQLIPIVLERPLWSERLARWQFVVATGGVIGMVAHFFIGERSGLLWAAGIVGAAVVLHLVNVGLSLRERRRWTFTARLVVLAFAGLGLTTLFGLLLAIDRVWAFLPGRFYPTLHAHFHLALLGWVAPMVLGVSARIYPMFLLADAPEGRLATVQLAGLALGVPALTLGLTAVPWLVPVGALGVAAALGGHLVWLVGTIRRRKRPALDRALWLALVGAGFLVPSMLLGLALALDAAAGPRAALAYAVLGLGGWVTLTIAGMMLKIVPFLVWYRVYASRVGSEPVPTLAQLSWPAGERAACLLLPAGVAMLAPAVWLGAPLAIRVAGAVLALGALAFAAVLARVLSHLLSRAAPRAEPRGIGAATRCV